MPPVTVPEKTLEHWVGIYLTYRYKSSAGLWWPTKGADTEVHYLPHRPGKGVALEIKTCTPSGKDDKWQDVVVNLGQLWEYSRALLQPFYVFPVPTWKGGLKGWVQGRAQSAGPKGLTVAPPDLAFSRTGDMWFAAWMRALTTAQVMQLLGPEVQRTSCACATNHGPGCRVNAEVTLLRVDFTNPKKPTILWGPRSRNNPGATRKAPTTMPFRDLWTSLDRCGGREWPQLLNLPWQPGWGGSPPPWISYDKATGALEEASSLQRDGGPQPGEIATYVSDGEDGFEWVPSDPWDAAPTDETPLDENLLVFLEAQALYRG